MATIRRCVNDSSLGYDTDKGCPITSCYRNENGACITTVPNVNSAQVQKSLAAAADVVVAITTAIDITSECVPAKTVADRTQRFYKAKRNFFREAGITLEQVQTALNSGVDWISLLSVKRLEA